MITFQVLGDTGENDADKANNNTLSNTDCKQQVMSCPKRSSAISSKTNPAVTNTNTNNIDTHFLSSNNLNGVGNNSNGDNFHNKIHSNRHSVHGTLDWSMKNSCRGYCCNNDMLHSSYSGFLHPNRSHAQFSDPNHKVSDKYFYNEDIYSRPIKSSRTSNSGRSTSSLFVDVRNEHECGQGFQTDDLSCKPPLPPRNRSNSNNKNSQFHSYNDSFHKSSVGVLSSSSNELNSISNQYSRSNLNLSRDQNIHNFDLHNYNHMNYYPNNFDKENNDSSNFSSNQRNSSQSHSSNFTFGQTNSKFDFTFRRSFSETDKSDLSSIYKSVEKENIENEVVFAKNILNETFNEANNVYVDIVDAHDSTANVPTHYYSQSNRGCPQQVKAPLGSNSSSGSSTSSRETSSRTSSLPRMGVKGKAAAKLPRNSPCPAPIPPPKSLPNPLAPLSSTDILDQSHFWVRESLHDIYGHEIVHFFCFPLFFVFTSIFSLLTYIFL